MERAQRVDTHMDNGLALVVAVVLMAAVFVLDVFTPLGIYGVGGIYLADLVPVSLLPQWGSPAVSYPHLHRLDRRWISFVASGNLAHHRRGQSDDGRRPFLDHDHRPLSAHKRRTNV